MEAFSLAIAFLVIFFTISFFAFRNASSSVDSNLPPGGSGWPIVGESLDFLVNPEKFVSDRMKKHSPDIFRTNFFGEKIVIICGPNGHKFLFSNEDKHFTAYVPKAMQKLFLSTQVQNSDKVLSNDEMKLPRFLAFFLKPEALVNYVAGMDSIIQKQLKTHLEGKTEVKMYTFSRSITLTLACRFFLGLENPERIAKLVGQFDKVTHGIHNLPLNIPGTAFHYAVRAAGVIRKELTDVIAEKRARVASGAPTQDVCTSMVVEGMSDEDIKQLEISKSKQAEELLRWGDMQKMKYSWAVVCESMRLIPPVLGTFREAITDFSYGGFTVPKGWKFLEPLELCHRSLCACGDRPIADGSLLDFLQQVSTFGLSLVRLNIRQESDRHTDVIDAITRHLEIGSYREWPEQIRQEWLLSKLSGKRPLFGPDLPKTEEVADVLDTFHVISQLPSDNFGDHIISMATAPYDVLAVELLQHECRVKQPLRVVETLSASLFFDILSDITAWFCLYYMEVVHQRGNIETLRAIPCIFAWTQTRFHLPVWLGFGAAFKHVIEKDVKNLHMLKEMYNQWPFFRVTIDLVEMVFAKGDSRIAALYDKPLVLEDLRTFGETLRANYEETKSLLLQVRPHLSKDITESSKPQTAELVKLNPTSEYTPGFQGTLILTKKVIAAGMQNTG
ncbi:hypothetical protein RHGRI_010200 [Rhododendron griersonianum]|uniref:Uncharacterized protein n=1 Tax=Rhododendron griersonianum TaxID=479676 RepID=A0AAV6KIB3_9ERIC|nr:hypothetical protein RHGRI_010200 [Rhododendron griersonianum]